MGTRQKALAGLVALAVAGAAAHPGATAGTQIRQVSPKVTPKAGSPDTRFRVEFRARNHARGGWAYDIEATGPDETREDCSYDFQAFRHPRRGDVVVVKMPRRRDAAWCPGTFEGVVFLQRFDRDGDTTVDRVVGRFSFEVQAARR